MIQQQQQEEEEGTVVAEFAIFRDVSLRRQSFTLTLTSGEMLRDGSDCSALAVTISKDLMISTNILNKIVRETGGLSNFRMKLDEARASLLRPVRHGDVFILDYTATRLGKHVLLAVHPTRSTLEVCYNHIVRLCKSKHLTSLALPCIGSGLSAIAPSACAAALCSVVNHLARQRDTSLSKIKIISHKRETVDRFVEMCEVALQFKQRMISTDKAENKDKTKGGGALNAELDTTGWTENEKRALKYVKFGVEAADDICMMCLSSLCYMGNETLSEVKDAWMENGEESIEKRFVTPVAIANCKHQLHFGCFVCLMTKFDNKHCPTCRKHFVSSTDN